LILGETIGWVLPGLVHYDNPTGVTSGPALAPWILPYRTSSRPGGFTRQL